jgi:hypothetical protein
MTTTEDTVRLSELRKLWYLEDSVTNACPEAFWLTAVVVQSKLCGASGQVIQRYDNEHAWIFEEYWARGSGPPCGTSYCPSAGSFFSPFQFTFWKPVTDAE